MSLSKFYKASSDFKPVVVLKRETSESEPVWESIVKLDSAKPGAKITAPVSQPNQEGRKSIPSPEPIPETKEPKNLIDDPPAPQPPTSIPQDIPPEPVVNINDIREESFNAGVTAGRKQAEKDFENGAQTLLCICNELDRLRETILQNSIGEMRELVLAIAEKIIRHSVEEQSETITATIIEAIHLAVKSDEFQIQLNPKDLACVEEKKSEIINQISGLDNISLKPDATLERGGCKIESISCTIDASMASQLKVIRNSIMTSE
ncbi:MAG: flagellar assembly protein FliH [Proteobacteria bacterium]|nr:flagellar assembly protein FliH [Pseudomonadota bacterium]MBU1059944.1 flagellar assembly protein FliH [Pseudomonadota bacterium]